MRQAALPATAILLFSAPAAFADCEDDARAAMLDVAHPVPMRQTVTTEMAGNTIESFALSTPDGRGMALDANETPVSLWIGGRFYSSADGGESWTLVSEQTQDQRDAQAAGRRTQADDATNIACDYGVDLDGRTVNRFALDYVMTGSGIPVTSQYWVDADTRFPWRVIHAFGGANPSVITQNNEPANALTIPDPDG
ncbi:MAG: hypothetical protein JJ920_20895 [Roseitalea sp.]|jgi:hypothetical protein|nr:hypothetical protein [Roseitalea sp.]MBO6723832.1 hypothetical protein [Roseitalea sp.]MBO6745368.1 hypothetical protein [Roseitalea sp.]